MISNKAQFLSLEWFVLYGNTAVIIIMHTKSKINMHIIVK